MKKLVTLLFGILLTGFTANANHNSAAAAGSYSYDGSAYVFIEGAVEFSVFPDGQFDFVYLGRDGNGNVNVNISTNNVNLNFNSGYNYDPYVQYDDYGAVIQIEDIPIFYDNFGRIIQAGNTEIRYRDRRIVRVGGLRVFYNYWGGFDYCTGYINLWTPRYVWRPWHVWYVRPLWGSCIVYDFPYRAYYTPIRYSWAYHNLHWRSRAGIAYANGRRSFHRPGSRIHYRNGRTAINRDFNPNRRNTMVSHHGRRDAVAKNVRSNKRSDRLENRKGVNRSGNKNGVNRSGNSYNNSRSGSEVARNKKAVNRSDRGTISPQSQ